MKSRRFSRPSRWKMRLGILAALILFLFSAFSAFPTAWNTASAFVEEKTPLSLGRLTESEFRLGLDLQGGTHLVYEADMSSIPQADREDALQGVKDVIERRVNAFGVAEPLVQTTVEDGHYRVIIELAGVLDVSQAIALIGETPILEFKEENPEPQLEPTETQKSIVESANAIEREKAEEVLARAQTGEDFAALVNEFSISYADKQDGGDTGWTTDSGLYAEVISTISADQTGQVLPSVFETENGLEVLKLTEVNPEAKAMELSHILVCFDEKEVCPEGSPDRLGATLQTEKILDGLTVENFAERAQEFSDDPGTAAVGGSLGTILPGETIAAFEEAATALAVGGISGVIETEYGFHIIYKQSETTEPAYRFQRIVMKLTQFEDLDSYQSGLWLNTELSGKQLQKAQVVFDQNTNEPMISIDFNDEGKALFAEITDRNVGKPLAIFLDGEIITAPTVQESITGGQATISGSFTIPEARLLAQRLNAGALPVAINLLSQQTVGPTLGQVSLNQSLVAGLIGFAFVALFMVVYYRLPGLLAVKALIIYVAINLMLWKFLGVTITLAGIAGFILSMGIAVDANVLIFARLKEELNSGRDLLSAIDEAARRAWTSIRDGNMTTLIATAILFSFSTSFIKGFALTLAIGVLLSMFSAVVLTRLFLKFVAGWKWVKPGWLFGVKTR